MMIALSLDLILCKIPVVKNCPRSFLTLISLKKQRPLPLHPFAFGDLHDVILSSRLCRKEIKWLPGFFIVTKQNAHNI